MPQQRAAIIAVHGVVNHARYEMQDQVAENLAKELSSLPGGGQWECDVVPSPDATDPSKPAPTITRVHLQTDPPDAPQQDFFDVIEAYWSPIDKGKTTPLKVILWLLASIFVPLNNTARFVASPAKRRFDSLYAAAALITAILLFVGSIVFAVIALAKVAAMSGATAEDTAAILSVLSDPAKLAAVLTPYATGYLATGALGALLLVQGVRGILALRANWGAFALPSERMARIRILLLLFVVAAVLLGAAVLVPIPVPCHVTPTTKPQVCHAPLGLWALWFIAAALCFQGLRSLLQSWMIAFFGDLQIYTTRDENSEFFASREQILEVVAGTIAMAAQATNAGLPGVPPSKRYDRVFVMAHSLGSTIAMDALIRLYNAQTADASFKPAYASIRGFLTFGTALEKTKYFFDLSKPTVSQSFEQWRNDAYGVIFTAEARVLQYANGVNNGIFWWNYWYFDDPICNKIESYRSYLVPGNSLAHGSAVRGALAQLFLSGNMVAGGTTAVGRMICWNMHGNKKMRLIPLSQICIHGDYLADREFWHNSFEFADVRNHFKYEDEDRLQKLGALTILRQNTVYDQPFSLYENVAGEYTNPIRYQQRSEQQAGNLGDRVDQFTIAGKPADFQK